MKSHLLLLFLLAMLSSNLPYKLTWKYNSCNKMEVSTIPLRSVELNKEQEAATIAPLDNIRVIAGPGSGKTRVLVSRILHLINNEKIKPSEILAVTFTKRAALELYSRVINNKNIQDSTAIKMLTTSTLHSFCSKILRIYSKYDNLRNDYSIYDESDCKKIVRNVLKEQQRDLSEFSVPLLIEQISLYKRTGDLGSIFPTVNEKSIAFMEIFKQYRATLVTNNAKDFDDLILDTLKILQDKNSIARQYIKNKYRHLLIDEFQDIDNNQFQLLVELAKPEDDEKIKRTIYVVGDPYQTIYSWRGANPLNMELFAMKYPQCKTFVLKNNYRSNYKIVSAARHLMQNTSTISSLLKNKGNIYRITADSEAVGNTTSSSVHNDAVSIVNAWHDKSQAEYVAHMIDYYITNNLINGNEIAVMYRTHSQSIPLQTALLSRQIKYIIIGDISLMNRKEIKDALAYLRLLTNNDDSNALKRIINYPPRGIGESLQSKLFPTDGSGDSNGNLLSLLVYLGNNEINKNVTDAIDPLDNESVTEKDIPKLVLQDLTTRQLKSLTKASETFYELDKLLHHYEGTMEELVVEIFQKSGLTEYIREKNSKDSKVAPRLNHLDQLIYLARIYDIEISNQDPEEFFAGRTSAKDRLRDCLDTFLLSSNDEYNDIMVENTARNNNKENSMIKLMTLHASKGLEFDCVFITGLEQNVLPLRGRGSSESKKDDDEEDEDDDDMDDDAHTFDEDEERRLLYVGMTRARQLLTLTYRSRFLHTKGRTSPAYPSIFLKQLPKDITFLKY